MFGNYTLCPCGIVLIQRNSSMVCSPSESKWIPLLALYMPPCDIFLKVLMSCEPDKNVDTDVSCGYALPSIYMDIRVSIVSL
jgi:hypothetical protein